MPISDFEHTAIRVVRGAPTEEELAALVAVAAVLVSRVEDAPVRVDGPRPWAVSARPGSVHLDRRPTRRGGDAWRAAARPQ